MIIAQIYADIICILILAVVLGVSLFKVSQASLKTHFFMGILSVNIISLVVDLFVDLMDGVTGIDGLLTVCNAIEYIISSVMLCLFAYYWILLLRESKKISFWFAHAAAISCVIGIIYSIVIIAQGKLFTVKDGVFIEGTAASNYGQIQIAVMIYLMILTIIYARSFGAGATFAIILYMVFPVLGTVAEMFWPVLSCSFVGSAISCTTLYILVQAKESFLLRNSEERLREVSSTDALTGLKNRRAFMECTENMPESIEVGIVFCDINGLKKTNDTMGHDAGDKLICRFAGLAGSVFEHDKIYRIGGDEFVAIITGIGSEEFNKMTEKLREDIWAEGRIASIGAAYGSSDMIMTLMAEAEKQMYADKKDYHAVMDK